MPSQAPYTYPLDLDDIECPVPEHVDRSSTSFLEPSLSAKLHNSLVYGPSDGASYATSARLWEQLLDDGYRTPYLLGKVAALRWSMGKRWSAVTLYKELDKLVSDDALHEWVLETESRVWQETEDSLNRFLHDRSLFSPSQQWNSCDSQNLPSPSCRTDPSALAKLTRYWGQLDDDGREVLVNMHCLYTLFLENVVCFDYAATDILSYSGFDNPAEYVFEEERSIEGGDVRDIPVALAILRDVKQAYLEIRAFAKSSGDKIYLTPEIFSYTHIGTTRTSIRINVMAQQKGRNVQFCPFNQVDSELQLFCDRFNNLIHKHEVDPLVAAAWIHDVFITIHPFEDGNGRLARLLSSIPLFRCGLPPLTVAPEWKIGYIHLLNVVREKRDGNYAPLARAFALATAKILENARYLVEQPPTWVQPPSD